MPRKYSPTAAPTSRRITLIMHPWAGYLHQVRLGITDYLLQKPDWRWVEFWPSVSSFEEIAKIESLPLRRDGASRESPCGRFPDERRIGRCQMRHVRAGLVAPRPDVVDPGRTTCRDRGRSV